MWNGYIPAYQINSVNATTGKPNGVMGVPANYKPAPGDEVPHRVNRVRPQGDHLFDRPHVEVR
jgi:hypothetical protein